MVIVLPLHRESLRQMMQQGRVNHLVKIQVLEMLKSKVVSGSYDHGDIKDNFGFPLFTAQSWFEKPKYQPDNILVDYDYNAATVSNFRCYLADWGTAGNYKGGTPMYAGPRTYENISKDLFSCGQLALELFLAREGKMTALCSFEKARMRCS